MLKIKLVPNLLKITQHQYLKYLSPGVQARNMST